LNAPNANASRDDDTHAAEAHARHEAAAHARHTRDVTVGTILAFVSAILYTATNMCLKAAAESDLNPYWISFLKAVPTFVLAGALVGWDRAKGKPLGLSRTNWFWLFMTGLLAHLGGNVTFQVGLEVVGLAAAVPLVFSMILVGGAVLGRMWLGEGISLRSVIAITVLCVSIGLLGWHSELARTEQPATAKVYTPLETAAAIGIICCSGMAFSVLGVVIRRMVTAGAGSAPTLLVISIAGIISLGVLSIGQLGLDGLLATSPRDFAIMLGGGTFNAVAFFLLTKAFHLIPVTYVNVVNASQTAMAALAGVVYFHEPSTSALVTGMVLMVAGLFLMDRPQRR